MEHLVPVLRRKVQKNFIEERILYVITCLSIWPNAKKKERKRIFIEDLLL